MKKLEELGITPGEWKLTEDSPFVYALNNVGSNRMWMNVSAGFNDTGNRISDEELSNNGTLIAAAPKLYKALQELTESYVSMINSGDCGNWDPEKDPEVAHAYAALAAANKV
ncbi:MAG: hypothetical protein KAS32_24085 [Candidatus Peribacteraceae bacterium]|nr:hypothetical protein [Candidatus Peribacteraceae bacterium]